MSYGGGHGTVDGSISQNNVSAVSTGLAVDFGVVFSHPIAQVETIGATSGGVILLEGSLDGRTWYQVGTSTITVADDIAIGAASGFVVPARYARTRITTAIVGGTITSKIGAGA